MEVLPPVFREAGEAILLDKFKTMLVDADETTYGFRLENAYPAIMLSLNIGMDGKSSTE